MMMKGIWIIPIAALMVLPGWARADGCNPRYQECGSYKDEPAPRPRARAMSYSYAYSVRETRANWRCPPELSRRECRRIQAEVEARRRRVSYTPRALRNVDPGPERIQYRRGDRARCIGHFKVDGDARWTLSLARSAALTEWREQVARSARGGEAYMDESYARGFRIYACRIASKRGLKKVCSAEGIPCQAN